MIRRRGCGTTANGDHGWSPTDGESVSLAGEVTEPSTVDSTSGALPGVAIGAHVRIDLPTECASISSALFWVEVYESETRTS